MATTPSSDTTFQRLFETHHAALLGYCLRRLPVDDANEAASEIFLVAWRRLTDVPIGDQALLWLYGVARNVVRNWERSGRRRLRLVAKAGALVPPAEEEPEVHIIRHEEHQEVIDAMATLKDVDREVVRLKIWEGLSNEEAGVVLGMTDRAVEGRYTRSIKKLHKQLKTTHVPTTGSPFSTERGEAAL